MGLDNLLRQIKTEAVTPVTPQKNAGVTTKPAPILAVTPATPVTPKIIKTETKNEIEAKAWQPIIEAWLDSIGEDDPLLRNTCLNQCRRDPEAREYFLGHATKAGITKETYKEMSKNVTFFK